MVSNYERVEAKVDKILEKIGEIDKTLVRQEGTLGLQHEQLVVHIKRTELNEEDLKLLRKQIEPIQKHVSFVEAAAKMAGFIVAGAATLVGLIAGVFKILEHL